MQDQSQLQPEDLELIEVASGHAKKRFRQDVVSIAGAVRTQSGKIYTGINLKYRLGNANACGETMAIYAALNDGQTKLDTVVGVKYLPETDSFQVVNGCGWCRQFFVYNAPLNVIIDNTGTLEVVTAERLLPNAFL